MRYYVYLKGDSLSIEYSGTLDKCRAYLKRKVKRCRDTTDNFISSKVLVKLELKVVV